MARKPSSINARKSEIREPKPKVLIVCEGKKTEPDYLNEIKNKYRLANVVVIYASTVGSAPVSVVECAKEKNKEQSDLYGDNEQFEKVFCVYDTDEHESLDKASQLIHENNFKAIISNVCFEYWLLLHYEYTRAPILRKGNKSAASVCVSKLKKHIAQYDKSKIKEYFPDLFSKLDIAIKNSKKSYVDAEKTKNFNPSTNMYELITFLQSLSKFA